MKKEEVIKRIFGRFSKKALQTIGAPATIEALASALEIAKKTRNKYETFREFLKMDPELYNAVMKLALLTQFAYKGVVVIAGQELSEEEKTLQELANEEADALDFRGQFFSIAKHLLRDGDEIFVTHWDEQIGAQQIQPLPISLTTIVEKEEQIGKISVKIQGKNFYLLNEFDEANRQKFPENENQQVFHISLDNRSEEVYDIHNRWTFGVWSESPLEVLKTRILWKQAILITDILWRYRNVPREVHKLDTSMFTPEKFSGDTWEARVSACMSALETYLKDYGKKVKKKKVDQGYIIGTGTEITYTNPQISYASPNELIEQINRSIREGMGAYEVGRGTFATELVVASFVVLLPDLAAYRIKQALLPLLRKHLMKKHGKSEEEVKKLDIKLSLVLDIFKGEMARTMAVIAATGTQTIDELREMMNKGPMTDAQAKRVIQIGALGRTGQYAQTLRDFIRDSREHTEPQGRETPHTRTGDQET